MKTEFLKVDPLAPSPEVIRQASRVIGRGGLLVFPTETVYGLGGDGDRPEVVERIFTIKGREREKPLVRLIAYPDEIALFLKQKAHRIIAKQFWPGPLTLIVRLPDGSRQGFRCPDHILVRRVIEQSAVSLVATSANLSGAPEVVTGSGAEEEFAGKVDLILDGGEVPGVPSTVLDLSVFPEVVLREGALDRREIEECLGRLLEPADR